MHKLLIRELHLPNSEDELFTLSDEQQQRIIGGLCYYAGQAYSTGSVITTTSGEFVCTRDGTWSQR
ncbi:hypothetical protein NSTC745_04166 [Nostoc sp. DSM 114161]|jgi:hypothetical protein|uniref:DUF1496 domain-containing protein n=1 Tax=Nostoc sp. DSM 114161 TaxID=3440143 RepID=UPI0040458EC6